MTFRAILAVGFLLPLFTSALSLAPPKPLPERIKKAEKIFVGTLVNRVDQGDNWVHAELRVDEALRGANDKETVKVIWRPKAGQWTIFDAKEGARGIALLGDKHNDRYWLRRDNFEPVSKLAEVKKAMNGNHASKPTFEEWVQSGKKLPEGMMFAGGSPWFNERTGKKRTDKEVYQMIYPKAKPAAKKPAAGGGRFPAHWGEPPRIQTRDLRPLPGGYGRGSGTLAKWIQKNLDADAKKKNK
jgi:hypothetical protein